MQSVLACILEYISCLYSLHLTLVYFREITYFIVFECRYISYYVGNFRLSFFIKKKQTIWGKKGEKKSERERETERSILSIEKMREWERESKGEKNRERNGKKRIISLFIFPFLFLNKNSILIINHISCMCKNY